MGQTSLTCAVGNRLLLSFLLLAAVLTIPDYAFSDEKDLYFELGIGGGENLNGLGTRQILFAPGLNMKISGVNMLRFRVEANTEFVYDHGQLTVIGGITPFLRFIIPSDKIRPFLEIGGGPNLSNRDDTGGRILGGRFFISAMAGGGIEFVTKDILVSLSYRARHLSNANLYSYNQGLNSHYLILAFGF